MHKQFFKIQFNTHSNYSSSNETQTRRTRTHIYILSMHSLFYSLDTHTHAIPSFYFFLTNTQVALRIRKLHSKTVVLIFRQFICLLSTIRLSPCTHAGVFRSISRSPRLRIPETTAKTKKKKKKKNTPKKKKILCSTSFFKMTENKQTNNIACLFTCFMLVHSQKLFSLKSRAQKNTKLLVCPFSRKTSVPPFISFPKLFCVAST